MKRLYLALLYSLSGLKLAFCEETAFKQEVMLAIIMIPLAVWLAPTIYAMLLMIFSIVLVLCLELVNTGIEAAVDYTGTKTHPLAKKAKDAASAAVLLALINVAVVWGAVIFGAI